MKVILKRDEFNELNKEYEVHHIEQDKYGNKKIYLNKHRWVAPCLVEKYIEGENMKTTIYELLGMIKDGKAPKKILFENKVYELADNNDYYCFEDKGLFEDLFDNWATNKILDTEVEILETTITYNQDNIENNKQDKIEKFMFTISKNGNKKIEQDIINLGIKINEIIEVINEKRSI